MHLAWYLNDRQCFLSWRRAMMKVAPQHVIASRYDSSSLSTRSDWRATMRLVLAGLWGRVNVVSNDCLTIL